MSSEQEHYLLPIGTVIVPETGAILQRAEQAARASQSSVVGTDHLLLGCVAYFEPFFQRYGIQAADVEKDLLFDSVPNPPTQPPAGMLARRVLHTAQEYAATGGVPLYPEHIVLSLLDTQEALQRENAINDLFHLVKRVPKDMLGLFMRESLRRRA